MVCKRRPEMKKILLTVLFLCLLTVPVYAQSTLVLQEKCAEGAKKFFIEFKNHYRSDSGLLPYYTCHYNKKLDRCFIHISVFTVGRNSQEDCVGQYLFDVFGGVPNTSSKAIEYGRLQKFPSIGEEGEVMGKACKSKAEFEALIKPYMEE
jgi:hypothetical protein